MSSLLSAELSATCSALGSHDRKTGKYLLDQYTLESVKDLIRFLRRDDEDHEVRRHLGATDVLSNDLIPILVCHSDNGDLFDVTLRLVVNLTNPPLLLYREEIPTEKGGRRCYIQMVSQLMNYKKNAFTSPDVWVVLAKRLSKILEIDSSERDEDNGLIIERILVLVRNVLHIPIDDYDDMKPDNDASIHDQVLWALNQSGLLDVVLYMASTDEKQYYLHILEIVSLVFREQNPASLASAALQRSMEEKLKDEQELLSLRKQESEKKVHKIRNFSANRHSNFGGTFVVKNMKSISDNDLVCHKPLQNICSLNFDSNKDRVKKPKNRRPPEDAQNRERRSAFAIRLFLKEFCVEFLNAAYNRMMYYVKDLLARSKGQKNDETYYMWAIKFFMEFNRNYNFEVKLVSETMSVSTFHYVQQQMEKCFEMIMMDKKKCGEWVRRLHLALRAYNELFQTMMAMDKSTDPSVKESSKVIKSNIFYVLEYREFILQIFLTFDETKMPKAYLKDLIETVHIFLKILESFHAKHGLVVQKKGRKSKKGKSKKVPKKPVKSSAPSVMYDKDEIWNEIQENLSNMLFNGSELTTSILPFDATLEKDIEEQKSDCMKKIQKLLLEKLLQDAIGLLRAGRDVWPDQNIFGSPEMTGEEELSLLRTIFFADIGAESLELNPSHELPQDEDEENDNFDDEDDEENEEEERETRIEETDFNFNEFISRFTNPKVVKACCILMQNFEKNTPFTNHCIVKMLHRIAWDCKFPSMMFQALLFRSFQKILVNPDQKFKELKKFAIFIIQKFAEVAKENRKVFMELLFWKTSKEAYQIEHNYNDMDCGQSAAWSEEQEEELTKLYMENQRNPTTEMDVIDWILENLIDRTRTRRAVIKKLKQLGLIFKAPTRKSNAGISKPRAPKEFTPNEDDLLETLWSEYSSYEDPISMVIAKLPFKRSKKLIIDRLLELNIVRDRKDCRKKRSKKSKSMPNNEHNRDSSSELSSTDSDSDVEAPPKQQPKKSNTDNSSSYLTAEFAKTLIQCVDEGFTEVLKWIMESFEEVALDQEAEGYDETAVSIPLVPITQECIEAIENRIFQDMLELLGLLPPANEQEIYWRIPGFFHFEDLRKRNTIINKAIEKTLEIPTSVTKEPSKPTQESRKRKNSSDEDNIDDLFQLLRARNTYNDESDEDDTLISNKNRQNTEAVFDELVNGNKNEKSSKKGKNIPSNKTVEKSSGSDTEPERSQKNETSSRSTKRLRLLSSSSDEDEKANNVSKRSSRSRSRSASRSTKRSRSGSVSSEKSRKSNNGSKRSSRSRSRSVSSNSSRSTRRSRSGSSSSSRSRSRSASRSSRRSRSGSVSSEKSRKSNNGSKRSSRSRSRSVSSNASRSTRRSRSRSSSSEKSRSRSRSISPNKSTPIASRSRKRSRSNSSTSDEANSTLKSSKKVQNSENDVTPDTSSSKKRSRVKGSPLNDTPKNLEMRENTVENDKNSHTTKRKRIKRVISSDSEDD